MKSAAVAVTLVFALSGCGAQEWSFDVQGASTLDADASVPIDSGPDVLKRAYCLSDLDCAQPASRCDLQSGKCVGCLTDFDCAQSLSPHCDPHLETCVVCIDDRDCTVSLTPHCNPFHSACQECVAPTDCQSGGPGTVPVCDVNQCFFSCADGGTCPASAPHCNSLRGGGRCAQCLGDSDCAGPASGPRCDPNGKCLEGMTSGPRPTADGGGVADSGDAAVDASSDASSDAVSDSSSRGDAMDSSD